MNNTTKTLDELKQQLAEAGEQVKAAQELLKLRNDQHRFIDMLIRRNEIDLDRMERNTNG